MTPPPTARSAHFTASAPAVSLAAVCRGSGACGGPALGEQPYFSPLLPPLPSLCPPRWAGDSLRTRGQRAFLGLRWGPSSGCRPSLRPALVLCKAGPGPGPSSPDQLFLGGGELPTQQGCSGLAQEGLGVRPGRCPTIPLAPSSTPEAPGARPGRMLFAAGSIPRPSCTVGESGPAVCVLSATFLTGGVRLPSLGARSPPHPIPAVATGGVGSLQPKVCWSLPTEQGQLQALPALC